MAEKTKATVKKSRATKPKTNKGGRPTDYKDVYAEQARKLCLLGATDKELANFFEVTEQTINNWKIKVPEFFESIKEAKEIADAEVAHSLNQKARGFRYIKQQPIKLKEVTYENGKRVKEVERVEVVPTEEVTPPDTTAGIFWLKNRRHLNWKDKIVAEHEGVTGILLSNEQAEQLIRARANRGDLSGSS